jgi:hypothetical protein
MAVWLIITGSGLDDWIYYRLLCTVSLNQSQLQEITINLQSNLSSLTAEDSLHSCSRSTTLQLNYADSCIHSARTTHRKHSSSVVACMSVGVPTWSLPSQSIGTLAAAQQWSRCEPHRKHRFCIVGRVFVWTCLPSKAVFLLHSFMLWANPSQYKTTEEKWEKNLGIYWKSSLCEYAHYEISLLLTSKMKHIPSSWPAIQTRTRSPEITSEQKWTRAYEKDYKRQRPRPVIYPYALHWL